jgi:hypothetical protein
MFEELTPEERKVIADIKVRAMMFDMDVDVETLGLIPKKQPVQEPQWLKNYKDKREDSDNLPDSPQEALSE